MVPLILVTLILKLVQRLFRSRKIVPERDLYPFLKSVIEAAVCISAAMASIVPTAILKPREYGLIGWADHLTLSSTNRSMTFEKAGE